MNYSIRTNLLNVKEVSAFLKLSALTVYKYISQKKIKAIHFGGRYLIDKSTLNKFTPHRNTQLVGNRTYRKAQSKNHKLSTRKTIGAGFTKERKLNPAPFKHRQ